MSTLLVLAASLAVIAGFAYAIGMYLESGLVKESPGYAGTDAPVLVFLIPCLNEERVIRATLDRLAAVPYPRMHALVIDDGSTDATYTLATTHPDPRVHVLRRLLPDAQQGKGAALNAAIRHLETSGLLEGHDPSDVVIGLLDADGRLGTEVPARVAPYFAAKHVGAVQVSVRINNRGAGLLERLQDMEFVVFTTVFQVARNRHGLAGLGGNGQFTRLSALLTLGAEPWSDVLTEDLDLGVRMQLRGWRTLHCRYGEVHQQGLGSLPRLLRQRSRWFQGHLQSWRLIPEVVRCSEGRPAAETLHLLLMPSLVLVSSLMTLSFLASLVGVASSAVARAQLLSLPVVLSWYALTFLPGAFFGWVYHLRSREGSLLRNLLRGHAFILYGLIWMVAGWWAIGRVLRGRRNWLKTDRQVEVSVVDLRAPDVIALDGSSAPAPRELTASTRRRGT